MGAKVLLVSEDVEAGHIWAYGLRQHGIDVALATGCAEVLNRRDGENPDMLIVDLYGYRPDAVNLCRSLRAEANFPVLMLVPNADELNLLSFYAAGADDCLAKPVSPLVLLAKVKAWLRWSFTAPADVLTPLHIGGLSLDPQTRQALASDGGAVHLTNLEFRLLHYFMSHPNQTLESSALVNHLWDCANGDSTMLKNVVCRLRRKLQPHCPRAHYIETVAGKGYRFSLR